MEIKKNLTTQNWNSGTINRIKYIVVHYTGNNGDTALANTNYSKSFRGASAHYFVDENNIYQSVEDKNIAWHCGSNYYYHAHCRNYNSIGVELCSRKNGNNYYFKDETVKNAVEIVKWLMDKYNVPIDNVIRHYDVTHKNCPAPFVENISLWNNFRNMLVADVVEEDDEVIEKFKIKINGKNYEADRIFKENKNFICIQDLAQAGFEIGYNNRSKTPSITNKSKEVAIIVDDNESIVNAINIDGNNYVAIRDIADITGTFAVDYAGGKVIINTANK